MWLDLFRITPPAPPHLPNKTLRPQVRWDNGRANSYETGANGKYSISFEDAVPGAPRGLVVSSVTDRSISIGWRPPAHLGRPALERYPCLV